MHSSWNDLVFITTKKSNLYINAMWWNHCGSKNIVKLITVLNNSFRFPSSRSVFSRPINTRKSSNQQAIGLTATDVLNQIRWIQVYIIRVYILLMGQQLRVCFFWLEWVNETHTTTTGLKLKQSLTKIWWSGFKDLVWPCIEHRFIW